MSLHAYENVIWSLASGTYARQRQASVPCINPNVRFNSSRPRARHTTLNGAILSAFVLLFSAACGDKLHGAPETGALAQDRRRALELVSSKKLPDRFEVVALADRLAVGAVQSKSRETSADLTGLAASLRERLFRALHSESDGREAAALLERRSEAAAPPQACEAALRRAALLGEIARDPAVTLREASAAAARFGDASCQARLEDLWSALAAYRAKAGVAARPPVAEVVVPGASASAPGVAAPVASGASAPGAAADDELVASPEPPPPSSAPVVIRSIETFGERESARIVVHLTGSTSFKIGVAPPLAAGRGPRLFVDLVKSRMGKHKREIAVGGLVERVRVGPHPGGARVVLDLSKQALRRVFFLPDPFRVVIDVSSHKGQLGRASKPGKRDVGRVVLDPGHGGHDPGATGPSGLREKDVTLDVAHRAAPVLARELGISTLLTRDGDEYVSLEERTARANGFGADVFVSIHCNASESGAARGVQTFVLDTTSDEIAMRVAARENNASIAQAGPEVARMLRDLRMADLGSRSSHLAELIQRSALSSLSDRFPGATDQGVKTAGFYVLVGAQMPAVLFETSFISNPAEEQRLASPDYRQRLADSIVNAIKAYRDGL
jgi:N-acetylmuramoyl-L-alanine amidase